MIDHTGRAINYLRISVTDRCNLRCTYCMPAQGIKLMDHANILTYQEITEFTKIAVSKGVDKVRITGGEPLVRKEITTLIAMLSKIDGIKDLSMTTNGILLEELALPLKNAGLMRVNVSLDTLDKDKYKELTRGGDLEKVIRGLEKASQVGLQPIKINCVVETNRYEPEAMEVTSFANKMGYKIRFIQKMDLVKGTFGIVDGGSGGDCAKCNRLRLTPDGKLKPCLFSDIGIDIKTTGYKEAIEKALEIKPTKGQCNHTGAFYNIGG